MLFRISGSGRISGMKELQVFGGHDGKESYVLNFSIAASKRVKKNNEWVDEPHFYNCTAWDAKAKFINEYRSIGDQLIIHGILEHETWDNEKSKGQRHNVIVTDVEFGRVKGDGVNGEQAETAETATDAVTDDGVPFEN